MNKCNGILISEDTKKTIGNIFDIELECIKYLEKLGGMTNQNYKLKINDEYFVLRIPGIATKNFINRKNEKINCMTAYEIGIDSKCIYFDEITGIKISQFIKNAITMSSNMLIDYRNIDLICSNLNRLHNSNKKFNNTFDAFYITQFYEKAFLKAGGHMYEDYYEIKKIFRYLKTKLNSFNIKYKPCHIDPLPENFIKSGLDKIYLIDWEYSGNYDPLWDVAAIILEFNLDEHEEKVLINKYLGYEPNYQEKIRIHIHKIMQDMFWSMWSATKAVKGEEKFWNYSLERYNRGKKNLRKYLMVEKEINAVI